MKKILSFVAALGLLTVPMLAGAQFDPLRGSSETGLSTIPFYDLLMTIVNYALVLLTIAGIIGFLISGFIFITAGGAGKADIARKWLTFSIVGIIVGLIGYIVIRLIDSIILGSPEA